MCLPGAQNMETTEQRLLIFQQLEKWTEPGDKPVRCRACHKEQRFLVCRAGQLVLKGPRRVPFSGFYCEFCGALRTWGTAPEGEQHDQR